METETIAGFDGVHRFLSNFAPSPIMHDGISYPTVEHAFQASKSPSLDVRRTIAAADSPGAAKAAGRAVQLRNDWENVKLDVMLQLLRLKFAPDTELARRLDETGDALLQEENYWGDTFWGTCSGAGANQLGALLMKVRAERRTCPCA